MKKPIAIQILKKIAPKIGADLLIEPEYGFVGRLKFKNGKIAYFRSSAFGINDLGAIEICKDKGYTKYFLKKFGYQVADGQSFFKESLNQALPKNKQRNIDEGFAYAKKIGLPVIIKPNNLSKGKLVAKIYNKKDYYAMAKKIFVLSPVMLVEKFYAGHDYRLVVLDHEVISAYERLPLQVTGNGKNTISELLSAKQREFKLQKRDTIINVADPRIKFNLKQKGLAMDQVLPKGKDLCLLDNSNLSAGGESIDYTDTIHPSFKKLAVAAAKELGLRLCGLDLIISNTLDQPLRDYVIIEVNGAPGLDNYAASGAKQNKIVEGLYLKVLKALEKQ
jgi:D-alanine-D-alanine ligase-like ATP-grasp enzyme